MWEAMSEIADSNSSRGASLTACALLKHLAAFILLVWPLLFIPTVNLTSYHSWNRWHICMRSLYEPSSKKNCESKLLLKEYK